MCQSEASKIIIQTKESKVKLPKSFWVQMFYAEQWKDDLGKFDPEVMKAFP